MAATVEVACLHCKNPFTARVVDRKRGWARFCSKSCKAANQAKSAFSARRPKARAEESALPVAKRPPKGSWIEGLLAGRSKMFDHRNDDYEDIDISDMDFGASDGDSGPL